MPHLCTSSLPADHLCYGETSGEPRGLAKGITDHLVGGKETALGLAWALSSSPVRRPYSKALWLHHLRTDKIHHRFHHGGQSWSIVLSACVLSRSTT